MYIRDPCKGNRITEMILHQSALVAGTKKVFLFRVNKAKNV